MGERTVLFLVLAQAVGSLCAFVPNSESVPSLVPTSGGSPNSTISHLEENKNSSVLHLKENLEHTILQSEKNQDFLQSGDKNTSWGLLADCEILCKICNATGKVQNGSCLCFADNGGELVCLHPDHKEAAQDMDLQQVPEPEEQLADGEGAVRGQRCLGMLGSTRGSLQSILGKGLNNMTAGERTAAFRKRVEALRSLTTLSLRRAKLVTKDIDGKPAVVPKTDLPVSPFISKPEVSLTPGNMKFSIGTSNGKMTTENGGALGDAKSLKSTELGTFSSEDLEVENWDSQVPTGQSVNGGLAVPGKLNLGSALPKLPASFLVPQLKDQLSKTESVAIIGDFGRLGSSLGSSESSVPCDTIPNPIIPNPLVKSSIIKIPKLRTPIFPRVAPPKPVIPKIPILNPTLPKTTVQLPSISSSIITSSDDKEGTLGAASTEGVISTTTLNEPCKASDVLSSSVLSHPIGTKGILGATSRSEESPKKLVLAIKELIRSHYPKSLLGSSIDTKDHLGAANTKEVSSATTLNEPCKASEVLTGSVLSSPIKTQGMLGATSRSNGAYNTVVSALTDIMQGKVPAPLLSSSFETKDPVVIAREARELRDRVVFDLKELQKSMYVNSSLPSSTETEDSLVTVSKSGVPTSMSSKIPNQVTELKALLSKSISSPVVSSPIETLATISKVNVPVITVNEAQNSASSESLIVSSPTEINEALAATGESEIVPMTTLKISSKPLDLQIPASKTVPCLTGSIESQESLAAIEKKEMAHKVNLNVPDENFDSKDLVGEKYSESSTESQESSDKEELIPALSMTIPSKQFGSSSSIGSIGPNRVVLNHAEAQRTLAATNRARWMSTMARRVPSKPYELKTPAAQRGMMLGSPVQQTTQLRISPTNFAQNTYNNPNENLGSSGGMIDTSGISKGLGTVVEGFIAIPQNGKMTAEELNPDFVSPLDIRNEFLNPKPCN